MATDPNEVQLTAELRRVIAELADRLGRSWPETLAEALRSLESEMERPGLKVPLEKSFFDVMREDGAIGVVTEDLPSDLSTNPKYLEGFGG